MAYGDISGIIELTGSAKGSLALSFSEACTLRIVSNMLIEEITTLNNDIHDAIGEITNPGCEGWSVLQEALHHGKDWRGHSE